MPKKKDTTVTTDNQEGPEIIAGRVSSDPDDVTEEKVEERMTTAKLHKMWVADYQTGMSPRQIVQKYSDKYPMKLSEVLEVVQPEGNTPHDKPGMIDQFKTTGE